MPALTRFEFDAAYVERLIAGDADVEAHFTAYFGELVAIKLRSRLRAPGLVEDVKQEVFVRVMTTLRRNGLDSAPSLGAFVNTTCNYVLFEAYRAKIRARQHEPESLEALEVDAPSAETTMVDEVEHARVRRAIAALPERERTLLRSVFFDERPKDEICRELGIDRGYLRVMLHRAKARFRETFAATGVAHETVGPPTAPIK